MGRLDAVERAHDDSFSNWPSLKPGVEGAPLKKSGVGGLVEKSVNGDNRVAAVLGNVDDSGRCRTWEEECASLFSRRPLVYLLIGV